jgi:hypothetical protein
MALAVLWALSLVAVSRWTANAQAPEFPSPPGYEVRFVPTVASKDPTINEPKRGELMANIGGAWQRIDVISEAVEPRLRPLGR